MDFESYYGNQSNAEAQSSFSFEKQRYNFWLAVVQERIQAIVQHARIQPPAECVWVTVDGQRSVSWQLYSMYEDATFNLLPAGQVVSVTDHGHPREAHVVQLGQVATPSDLQQADVGLYQMAAIFELLISHPNQFQLPDQEAVQEQYRRYVNKRWGRPQQHPYLQEDPFAYVSQAPAWMSQVLTDAIDNLEAHNWDIHRDRPQRSFAPGVNHVVDCRLVYRSKGDIWLLRNGGFIDLQGNQVDLNQLPEATLMHIFNALAKIANSAKANPVQYSIPSASAAPEQHRSWWQRLTD